MIDYKSAGVDLETYEKTIAGIGPLLKRTFSPRVMDWPNGFAGLFRLNDKINLLSRTYRDPVLVAGSDGVGTKLMLAFATGRHRTVGIDLVAMSVNDVLCCGAEPLFFLDYVAMSKDNPELTHAVVGGISDGCCRWPHCWGLMVCAWGLRTMSICERVSSRRRMPTWLQISPPLCERLAGAWRRPVKRAPDLVFPPVDPKTDGRAEAWQSVSVVRAIGMPVRAVADPLRPAG